MTESFFALVDNHLSTVLSVVVADAAPPNTITATWYPCGSAGVPLASAGWLYDPPTQAYVAPIDRAGALAALDRWFAAQRWVAPDGWSCGLDESTRNAWTSQILALQALGAARPLRFGATVTATSYTAAQAQTLGLQYMVKVDAALTVYYAAAAAINAATTAAGMSGQNSIEWSAALAAATATGGGS